jgi:hypothetical protein
MTVAAPNCRPSLRQEFERGVITQGHVEVIYEIRPSSQPPGHTSRPQTEPGFPRDSGRPARQSWPAH